MGRSRVRRRRSRRALDVAAALFVGSPAPAIVRKPRPPARERRTPPCPGAAAEVAAEASSDLDRIFPRAASAEGPTALNGATSPSASSPLEWQRPPQRCGTWIGGATDAAINIPRRQLDGETNASCTTPNRSHVKHHVLTILLMRPAPSTSNFTAFIPGKE
eukprot:TRINITY_DN31805_c0_g1_i1.p1 TRINITY_DN31805_c0_g1~~TRINITY_DN31805_c0_g1_i1.p1  ORF type:complete len:161 (-),score=14.14 TRINITY_DN31805_c0_g1_i1:4-486(-)